MDIREFFLQQADFADGAYDSGYRINCYMVAAAAIDALAAIWESDFPEEAAAFAAEVGGRPPASIRMARFVQQFAKDPRASRIAVVRFCEDALPHASGAHLNELETLLDARMPKRHGRLPHAHLDLTLDELKQQAPTLMARQAVCRMAEEYQYPALIYTLYRCPTVHALSYPRQAQGFVKDEEVFYMPLHAGFTSIGIGHKLLTNWLRKAVEAYVVRCASAGLKPGKLIEPGADQEARLSGKWKRAMN